VDWNVIQAPELLRRLTLRLGLKQAHVTPTLNEGVQAVVLLDDLQNIVVPGSEHAFVHGRDFASTLGHDFPMMQLKNPAGSAVLARLKKVVVACEMATAAGFYIRGNYDANLIPAVFSGLSTATVATLPTSPTTKIFSKCLLETGSDATGNAGVSHSVGYFANQRDNWIVDFPDPVLIYPGCAWVCAFTSSIGPMDPGDLLLGQVYWDEVPV
jgi:hypothetical protein